MEKVTIVKDIAKKVRRFNLTGRTLNFKINPVPLGEDPVSWVKDAITYIIKDSVKDLQPDDRVGFSFCSKDFRRGEGWMGFRKAGSVIVEEIWNLVCSIYQSNSTGLNTETFCLSVTSVRMPVGKGNERRNKFNSFNEECTRRRGIIAIKNLDNLCLPRALVVAIARINKEVEYNRVRKDVGKIQFERACDLMRAAGVTIPESGAGIAELGMFQKYLKNFKIVVYRYATKGRDVIFRGSADAPALNLLYHEGHYNVIASLTAAFCCVYYCEECNVPYDHKNDHRCGGTCPACLSSPSCPRNCPIKCEDCQRQFKGQVCFDNHKAFHSVDQTSVCAKIRRCNECLKTVKTCREHTCDEIFCVVCGDLVPANHLCYMKPDTNEPKSRDVLFIFYDLETRQETVLEDGSLLHEANLCVFKQCCDECMISENKTCKKCGPRLHVLRKDPINRFMEFVLNQRKLFKKVIVIAHNGQAFDHQIILNYILTQTNLKPELIMRGTKILLMKIGNVRFLDSVNYFPMPLSKIPAAFDLPDIYKKGYFPFMFNTKTNENYIGKIPDIEYYNTDSMKEKDRNEFLRWYEEHRNDEFNMEQEIAEYCISDVEILARGCLKFRQELLSVGNVCPFTEATTIASTCNKLFRRNFLKPDTIGIIPKNGYRWCDNQSIAAMKWLVWVEKQQGISISHAARQNEVKLHGMKVDGYCSTTRQIFEFQGCYYHGCRSCFKYNRDDPLYDNHVETMNTRYESTRSKTEKFRALGYDVIEIWECDFNKQLRDNEKIRKYTENHPFVTQTPLIPRDAFYGGRTGNAWEYYEIRKDEKIKYVDVCSLYPWVCKYGKFPIGHPKVYVGEDCSTLSLKDTDGLIKCKILPPRSLYHPVLPLKMKNKLLFVLCQTCGEEMSQSECTHNIEERCLKGTWVLDEVLKALELGYEMIEIYEIWKYDNIVQFDKNKNISGLFTEMMNKFVKLKQQASGWPKDCCTTQERELYIEEFLVKEDIQLEYAEIAENPGLRSLAKLILNSFWGKFGQQENQPKTKIVNQPGEFFSMVMNPSLVVNNIVPINDDTLVVNYEFLEETFTPLSTANVVIASYVTAQARLKLYSYLEKLGERVLYYDTDSVIYVSRDNDRGSDIPTGKFLGDMTDELESFGVGSYITAFVSGGPKNYAYKVFSTKKQEEEVVCKVKGISLTYAASQLVNFEKIKEMVLTKSDPIYITANNIRRTEKHEVITKKESKIYRLNSTKRVFKDDYSSEPYGFKKVKLI